ncbi:MAG: hypothetical protein ACR2KT_14150 [Methylocella sp.]
MGEMTGLEGFPIAFDVVESGRIFLHPFGREPVHALGQRGARCFAGMDGAIVQNDGDGFAPSALLSGLFIGMASKIVVGLPTGVEVFEK